MLRKYQVSLLIYITASATVLIILGFGHQVSGDRFSGLCPSTYPRQVTFNGTGRCYTVGSTGPCPKMMVVSSNPFNPSYGKCRCKSLGSSCFGRPLLEWDDRCYFEFSQGPCRKGHWLVRGKQGYATCQKNPCPLIENERDLLRQDIPRRNFYFTLHDDNNNFNFKCHKTGSQAFCGEGQKAYFLGSEPFPRCISYEPWDCDHYSGGGGGGGVGGGGGASSASSNSIHSRFGSVQSAQSQGDLNRRPPPGPAPGFGVPYDGI